MSPSFFAFMTNASNAVDAWAFAVDSQVHFTEQLFYGVKWLQLVTLEYQII